ncbi:MAG: nickel-dependent lactate racemase [Christensenellales bacterium]|jgi:nickel-dependent lactate racemase
MDKIQLKYGKSSVEIDLRGAASINNLEGERFAAIDDMGEAFLKAVETDCIQSPPLREIIAAQDKITIIISDITRFWMRQDKVVPLLVEYLNEKIGVAYENIVILIALGSHRFQTEDEMRTLVTGEIYEKIRVLNHDCHAEDLTLVGETSSGTQVYVNPLAVGRKVIVISGTSHHLMSGYSGGRKSILPGVSGYETIRQNHIHSLAPDLPRSNPLIGMGILQNNPVSSDMIDAAKLVSPVFGLNIAVSSQGEICRLIGGGFEAAWEKSCRACQRMMGVPISEKADAVVVSCGGFPKDMNLYQSTKAFINAAQAVKDGGEIVFLAQCPEGGGAPDFFSWIKPMREGVLDAALRENFTIAGYIFYAFCEAMERCSVHMLSDIGPDEIKGMKISLHSTPQELAKNLDFSGKTVYVMPYGGNTVPYLE